VRLAAPFVFAETAVDTMVPIWSLLPFPIFP
jgi:hypothetical protein